MTTHRAIQISILLDTAASKASTYRRCASNLARIHNNRGAGHYIRKADRFAALAARCEARLAA